MLLPPVVRIFPLAVTLLASVASAQHQVETANYWDRCYGPMESQPDAIVFGSYYVGPPPVIVDARPVVVNAGRPAPAAAPPAPPLSGLAEAGPGAGYAVLVAAVVAVAAFPVIIYAVDNDAPPRVLRRFNCASLSLDGWGGAQVGTGSAPWTGIAATRLRFGYSHFGTDVQFNATAGGVGSFSAHGLIRIKPKEHVEGGLALGYQRAYLGGTMREGFEIGLPHTYTLWRNRGRELQIELRPGVFITTQKTVDVSVDLAVLVPVLENMSIRLGTRVFSYDFQPLVGFNAGLSLHL